jgi:hypothetical protein|tara:strand:- start:6605 stop:6769 length:165 start_codon:yes stop_codon:yes gene_type:complete
MAYSCRNKRWWGNDIKEKYAQQYQWCESYQYVFPNRTVFNLVLFPNATPQILNH